MKIDRKHIEYSIDHIIKHGDTDLFPYPFELHFISERRDLIVSELADLDLANYHPMSLVESLIPKTRYGFRVAHQPYPIDTLIFTALVLSVYGEVEAGRDPAALNRAFSYRFEPHLSSEIFLPDHTYRDWLTVLQKHVFDEDFTHVVRTDISDFYQRIYRHRLENILESLSGNRPATKKIEKIISDWRSGQSFGLPVGTNAARLLAEAALNDTDMALISEGYEFTRYVDDIVVFIKENQDPYASLAFLAKHLSSNEGLSLNNQKTKILEWDGFLSSIKVPIDEDDPSKDDFATEKLFLAAYGNDELDQAALEALMMKDLRKELEDLLSDEFWNMGSIRVVLHAMRLVRNADVASYVRENLSTLVPFAKDVCLLIEEFSEQQVSGFQDMSEEIVNLLLSDRLKPLDCARAWFLELGVRKIVRFDPSQIRRLDALTGTLDIRQLQLIRWRTNDQNYFRLRKTRVSETNSWVQPSFIFGARCLPRDEYEHWIRGIRSRLQFPAARTFCDWCLNNHGRDPF